MRLEEGVPRVCRGHPEPIRQMTNSPFNAGTAFDDLEDEDFWADAPSERPARPILDERNATVMPAGPQFKERCAKCRGTGRFVGYTGRILGQCFACKGAGFQSFKTSGADRAKARMQGAVRKANAREAWAEANADVVAWVARRSTGNRPFDFAVSLSEKLAQYGSLTDGAVAAVRKMIAADAQRDAERAAQPVAERPRFVCETAKMDEAFDRAQAKGIKKPRAILGAFKMTRMPDGVMRVTHTERTEFSERFGRDQAQYLGKIVDGEFQPMRRNLQAGEAEALVAKFAELAVAGSVAALGQQTGVCCCCGAELTVKLSIERGMGPICWRNYGG